SDTLFGGNVTTFSKTTTETVEQLNSQRLQNLFQEGISLITYFGHSSASSFEFNLDDPMSYNNFGKYPMFITLGCNAGNLYNFNQNRFLTKETISENFVLAPDRGSIAFLATTSLGIVQYLDILNTNNYIAISRTKYGKSIGEIMQESIKRSFDITSQFDFYARIHCEQISLNGDPALKYNAHSKPDYVIEQPMLKITPSFITVADDSFKVDVKMLNMGRALDSNIVVEVKRTYPDNNRPPQVIRITIPGIRYVDSISVKVPINSSLDKGLNKITVTVDADNTVSELYETNNSVTKDVFIYDDDIRPVYPYNFAIINKQNIKLVASTANPFAVSMQYNMELDTTEFFNSPLKVTKAVTSKGGVIEFIPGITFTDSTVYYWRVAPNATNGQPKWNVFSFVYLQNSDVGFNQSHLFQHFKSGLKDLQLDSASRAWKFGTSLQNLFIRQGTWVTSSGQELGFSIVVNSGAPDIHNTCWFQSVVFNVFDPVTFKPWINSTQPSGRGLYGSEPVCTFPGRQNNFEYRWNEDTLRKKAMDFMSNDIPDGSYVVVRSFLLDPVTFPGFASLIKYASDWQADTAIYGSGQSLYHYLKNAGLAQIDSFSRPRNFALVYRKNDPSFTPRWVMTQGTYDNVSLSADCVTTDTVGYITSPIFGPAKAWKQLHWKGNSIDTTTGDNPTVQVYGIDQSGNETLIYPDLNQSFQDYDISGISATAYPYIKLRMRNMDSVNHTPYQMKYWRLTYVPAPEGAIAPNITFQMRDTVEVGEPLDFKIAFKNVSEAAFDSLKVKMIITDRNNRPDTIPIARQKPLVADSVLTISTTIDTRNLAGVNNLYINVNPDFDQPEQYLFNNFAYKTFYVRPDSLNPLLDVTFDGIHILNRDIVSSKPHILAKLKDETKWAVLSDTSLFTVKVRYPDGSLHRYYFNNDTLRFTPAGPAPNSNNTASIDFLPYFAKDGDYELIVTGKDMSNNQAGNMEYKVGFQVINKAMISNMLNYPNPFTTSTAFVFTLTGSEVPQNIKIEIMTITGKIVREITKDELGPLHIGRNITEFKWDGTDQYGQKLANGIYLYRVVTNLNGKSLDKYKAENDNTDKYFNKGYGKMYLMR
ncbi:MAG TPA: C25 family cysteine peptidase, partial [Chitinophagaceae bacterium]|nr:C25 family cysteine peptidase [Chitinophagaceae bacterium]